MNQATCQHKFSPVWFSHGRKSQITLPSIAAMGKHPIAPLRHATPGRFAVAYGMRKQGLSHDNNRQSEEEMRRSVVLVSMVLAGSNLIAAAARAETPQQVLAVYETQARAQDRSFAGFSAERGEAFWREPHQVKGATGKWSCASCHLSDTCYSALAHQTDISCRACQLDRTPASRSERHSQQSIKRGRKRPANNQAFRRSGVHTDRQAGHRCGVSSR